MIRVTCTAKKGAAIRTLSRATLVTVEQMPTITDEQLRVLQRCRAAANHVIAGAAAGEQLTIQLLVAQGPLGGWNGSVSVDAQPVRN